MIMKHRRQQMWKDYLHTFGCMNNTNNVPVQYVYVKESATNPICPPSVVLNTKKAWHPRLGTHYDHGDIS